MFEELFQQIMVDETKKEILKKSIVINGPIGSGKSLLSSQLSKITGTPLICVDLCRHLPTMEYLKSVDKSTLNNVQLSKLNKQIEQRTLMPNLEIYENWGFRKGVSRIIRKKSGIVAWHFYQKQFETRFFLEIVKNLNQPAILDLGGGMGISLDKHYKLLKSLAKQHDPELFENLFPLQDFIGFDKVERIMKKFQNVVCLHLPSNYKCYMDKAKNDELNLYSIPTGQYKKTATIHIDVSYLYRNTNPNWNRASYICENIIKQSTGNIKEKNQKQNMELVKS